MKTILITVTNKNLKRLSAKDYNKIISFVEKNLTWDNQVKSNISDSFFNHEKKIDIHIFRGPANCWSTLTISLNYKKIFRKEITSFKDIRDFKNMILALEA